MPTRQRRIPWTGNDWSHCPPFYPPHPLPGAGGYDEGMIRPMPLVAAILGLALLTAGILDGNYRELAIAGAILMTGALLAESPSRPS